MDLSEAVDQAPLGAEERKAKIAEARARTATAQGAPAAEDDKTIARIAPLLSGPHADTALQSPLMRKLLEPILQRRGMTYDPESIKSLVTPPVKPWSQWTPQERVQERALPPEMRSLPPDAPEAWRTAPAQAPLSGTSENFIIKRATDAINNLSAAKSQPNVALRQVLSARQELVVAGASTAALDMYLDPSHTQFDDGIKHQYASEYAEAQIHKMEALTGTAVDHEKVYKALTERKIQEFDSGDARANRRLDQGDRALTIRQQALAVQAQTHADNLKARWASISNTQTYRMFLEGQAIGKPGEKALAVQLGAVRGEYDKAVTQLEANTRAIANGANEDDLTDNSTNLKATIDQLGPQLRDIEGRLGIQPVADYTRITGHSATATKPADMKDGVVEWYQHLDEAGKSAYLKSAKVPQDVRDWLRRLR
jgi:hypothetical protein